MEMEVPTQSAEADPDTPTQNHPPNGVLRRHAPMVFVVYRECLRNQAAGIGGHAVDGCYEFLPCLTASSADPSSYICAACGCHRNFHRREPEGPLPYQFVPYHPGSSSGSPSHMTVAAGKKRFRSKFTPEQRECMLELAEKVGWKMQKRDDDLIAQSCNLIGVERSVFKVWMHNNKNNLAKKDQDQDQDQDQDHDQAAAAAAAAAVDDSGDTMTKGKGTNGSSSSSEPIN